jgi:hypothetical protein
MGVVQLPAVRKAYGPAIASTPGGRVVSLAAKANENSVVALMVWASVSVLDSK